MNFSELGLEGDILSVSGVLARDYLLPGGAAVYASPENIKKYEPIVQVSSCYDKWLCFKDMKYLLSFVTYSRVYRSYNKISKK